MFFHNILHLVTFHQHHYCRQMPRLYSNFECILKLHKSTLCVFFQDFILETIITKFTIWSFFKCFQIWWILFLHFMVYDNNILSKGSYSILFPMIYCMWWFCVFSCKLGCKWSFWGWWNDSKDTLANDEDAHKTVLCALSLILCDYLLLWT